jgi:S-DNA-T family DNA segregation ATPase FtsK/SpoIIIE
MAKKTGYRKPPAKPTAPPARSFWSRPDFIGFVLIAVAGLTLLSLFSLSQGALTRTWLNALRTVFGIGMYLVPLGMGAIGLWLVLVDFGEGAHIDWERPAGAILLFFILLTAAHLVVGIGSDMQTAAAEGRGGGYIGFGLASVLVGAVGAVGAWFIVFILFFVALILLLDITLADFARWLAQESRRLFARPTPTEPDAPLDDGEIWLPPSSTRSAAPPAVITGRPAQPASPPTSAAAAPTGRPVAPSGVITPVPERFAPAHATTSTEPAIPRISSAGQKWQLPTIADILEEGTEVELSQDEVRERVRIIEDTLASFGVPARVVEVNQGPSVTQFGVAPGFMEKKDGERAKVKVSRIAALSKDLALALAASPIRIEAPVPGRSIVGIEVPNARTAIVSLRNVMESEAFQEMDSPLRVALGQDVSGQAVCADLAIMPHLLIAGATGSGKSVCINAIVADLLCTNTPDSLRFLMVDPKRVELIAYNGIPHLLSPVIVDLERVVGTLQWATREMDRRYQLFAKAGVRNLEGYNQRQLSQSEEPLPLIVIVIDELADLMMVAPEEVERYVCRIAQMARATGMHLIIATQRPSVDVVTGLIKANFPARIAFAVSSQVDSRVILDTVGADQLLGRGDMLFMSPDSAKLRRLQGCYVSDQELHRLVRYWKGVRGSAEPASQPDMLHIQPPLWEDMIARSKEAEQKDDLFDEAVRIIQDGDRASISLLQRRLRIGYSRAARLIDLMEEKGIVGAEEGPTHSRQVLIKGRGSAPAPSEQPPD